MAAPSRHSVRDAVQATVDTPARAWRALDRSGDSGRRLYFGKPSSARKALVRRGLLVLALFLAVVLVFVLDRDGLKDHSDGDVSIADVIYFAMITITTVGYGDIVPVTQTARLIDAFLVTPVRILVWAIFFGTAYQFVAQRLIEEVRMRMRQASLRDHIVICGFGLSGHHAAAEIVRRGTSPDQIVVIDTNEAALLEAAEAGMVGLRGDATREAILRDANIGAAASALVSLGRDDTTVLCVLTLRALEPGLRIVASVKEAENERLVLQGGASATICSSTLSGILMANSLQSSAISRYVHDMLTIDGRIVLNERIAADDDVGKLPTELKDGIALRIHRGQDIIGFWEAGSRILPGDRLIVLAPRLNGAPLDTP